MLLYLPTSRRFEALNFGYLIVSEVSVESNRNVLQIKSLDKRIQWLLRVKNIEF